MKFTLIFDAYPSLETRGVFLDISKAFDRVWHEGFLYKLKSYEWSTLNFNKSFLTNRFQRKALRSMVKLQTGKNSGWCSPRLYIRSHFSLFMLMISAHKITRQLLAVTVTGKIIIWAVKAKFRRSKVFRQISYLTL